jgi:hypothetical protein
MRKLQVVSGSSRTLKFFMEDRREEERSCTYGQKGLSILARVCPGVRNFTLHHVISLSRSIASASPSRFIALPEQSATEPAPCLLWLVIFT